MCSVVRSLECDLFKEYNINYVVLRSRGSYYITAELMYSSGRQESMLIKKYCNYRDRLMTALQALYSYSRRG